MKPGRGLCSAAIIALTMHVIAQAPPNFAGHWTISRTAPAGADRGVSPGTPTGPFGPAMTIVQEARTLTIEYEQNGRPTRVTYNLDGSGTHSEMIGRGGEPFDQVTTAVLQGNRLTITITTQFGDMKRTLSTDGSSLKVEATPPPAFARGTAPLVVTYTRVK